MEEHVESFPISIYRRFEFHMSDPLVLEASSDSYTDSLSHQEDIVE